VNRLVFLLCAAPGILPADAQTLSRPAAELRTTCIPAGESELHAGAENCRVREFGRLTDLAGKETWYALYSNFPEPLAEAAKLAALDFPNVLVLFAAASGSDQLTPFQVSNPEGSFYRSFATPLVLATNQGTVLYVPGYGAGDGRGQFEYDQYLLWQQEQWIELDAFDWIPQVSVLLPQGYRLDGIYKDSYDFLNMRYSGAVRRDEDCHTCATGGTVDVEFELQGNSLQLKNFRYDPDALWSNPE
jgi:hypothetical protein